MLGRATDSTDNETVIILKKIKKVMSNKRVFSVGQNIILSSPSIAALNMLPNDGTPKGYVSGSDGVIVDGDVGTCASAQNGTHIGWAITLNGEVNIKTVAMYSGKKHV